MDFVVFLIVVGVVGGLVYWKKGDKIKTYFDKFKR